MRGYKIIVTAVTDICGVVVNIALIGNAYNTPGMSLKGAYFARGGLWWEGSLEVNL